jgi:hypothetical protein
MIIINSGGSLKQDSKSAKFFSEQSGALERFSQKTVEGSGALERFSRKIWSGAVELTHYS